MVRGRRLTGESNSSARGRGRLFNLIRAVTFSKWRRAPDSSPSSWQSAELFRLRRWISARLSCKSGGRTPRARGSPYFRHGNASQMPFRDESFDFVFCSSAFKNFTDPVGTMREMHRVLRPGGRALIIDLRKDASPQSIDEEIGKTDTNWFNATLIKLIFRFMLLKRAYAREEIENFAAQTRFKSIGIDETPLALEILLTK